MCSEVVEAGGIIKIIVKRKCRLLSILGYTEPKLAPSVTYYTAITWQ